MRAFTIVFRWYARKMTATCNALDMFLPNLLPARAWGEASAAAHFCAAVLHNQPGTYRLRPRIAMTRDVEFLVALWARAISDTEERALGWWLGELDEPILDALDEPRRYAYEERETSGFEPAAAPAVRKAVRDGVMSEEKGQRIIRWLTSVAADTALHIEYARNDPDFAR